MVDTRKIYTYENQRWNPVSGFSDIGTWLMGRIKSFPIGTRPDTLFTTLSSSQSEFRKHYRRRDGQTDTTPSYSRFIATKNVILTTDANGAPIERPMSNAHAHAMPRFFEFRRFSFLAGLPTDRPMWSDVGGREERRREDLKLPNSQWKWVSDWEVSNGRKEGGLRGGGGGGPMIRRSDSRAPWVTRYDGSHPFPTKSLDPLETPMRRPFVRSTTR